MELPPNFPLIVLCAEMQTATGTYKKISPSGKAHEGLEKAIEGFVKDPASCIHLTGWPMPLTQQPPRLLRSLLRKRMLRKNISISFQDEEFKVEWEGGEQRRRKHVNTIINVEWCLFIGNYFKAVVPIVEKEGEHLQPSRKLSLCSCF